MQFPSVPENETDRLLELYRYEILNTQAEEDFDDIVKLASEICQVPISTITLIDAHRQWHKAKKGIEGDEAERNITFCAHTILQDDLMEVPDAQSDSRFSDNPLVLSDPHIRFYAGMPLFSSGGYKIGTLCVIDRVPRKLTESQAFALRVLASQVIKLFDLRLKNREIEAQNKFISEQQTKLTELGAIQNKIISIISHDIRGPIASLQSILALRRQQVMTAAEASTLMETAEVQISQTLGLLGSLVEWAAILRNSGQTEVVSVRLHDMVKEELNNLQFAMRAKQNMPILLVPEDITVLADMHMLRFVIRNLLSNANKFTDNGTISIAAQLISGSVKISISDTGTGMSDEISNQLFKPEKRTSRPGTRNEAGSGVGLLLSNEFAVKMGSAISVFSEPGKGSSFYLTLPSAATA